MKEFLWTEKWAPDTIQTSILPEHVRLTLESDLVHRNLQNMLFHSSPGTGKTTCAKTLCDQIGSEYLLINGSDEGRFLSTARERVATFCSTYSLYSIDTPKVVIYDEFDNTPEDVQRLLRGMINDFQKTSRFIFTCNDVNKIHDAIVSRCLMLDFSPASQQESMVMAKTFFDRAKYILATEGVQYEEPALAQFIMQKMPDFRKMLEEMQRYARSKGKIDMGILHQSTASFESLFNSIMKKSFKEVREWINSHHISPQFYSEFTKYMLEHSPKQFVGSIVTIMAQYQYWASRVYDQDLNAMSCLWEVVVLFNNGVSGAE